MNNLRMYIQHFLHIAAHCFLQSRNAGMLCVQRESAAAAAIANSTAIRARRGR
jgi:hypothetical protein